MLLPEEGDKGFDNNQLNPYANQVKSESANPNNIEGIKEALNEKQEGLQWREKGMSIKRFP